MKKLNKVRGRITHAKQIKAGMTLWISGVGGVERASIKRGPRIELDHFGNRDLNSFWIMIENKYNSERTRSLNDMGVHQQGGYKNDTNRLFRTKSQADNWQVYLEVSGLRKALEDEQEQWEDLYEGGFING